MNTPSRRQARHAPVVRDIASPRRDNRATPKRDAPMPHEPLPCSPPLNPPHPLATDPWIVHGPIIRPGTPLPHHPLPHPMTPPHPVAAALSVHPPPPPPPALPPENTP